MDQRALDAHARRAARARTATPWARRRTGQPAVGAAGGGTWRIDSNDVYRLLRELEGEKLIEAREQPRRDKRPGTRVVYYPTELAPAALTRWIETLLPRETFRLGLHAKLAVARERDVPALRGALEQHRRECLELAAALQPGDGAPASWGGLFLDCTRDGIQRMLQTELDWVGHTLQRIDEYAHC